MASPGAVPRKALSAIVVAGGRSSRLGGSPKALMRPGSPQAPTLVEAVVAGLLDLGLAAERIAVVGPPELPLPEGVLRTREDPPFSGPASAVAAGAAALGLSASVGLGTPVGQRPDDDWTLTLACDMPRAGAAARVLLDASAGPSPARGIVLRDRDVLQPLAAIYRSQELSRQLAGQDVVDRSVRRVLGPLWDRQLAVLGLTDDVDTWDDVHRFGLVPAQD